MSTISSEKRRNSDMGIKSEVYDYVASEVRLPPCEVFALRQM